MQSAVGGVACLALVPGYDIAAMPATIISTLRAKRSISSMVAYGPTNLPATQQFVVLMEVDHATNPYASETAAPAIHNVLQKLFTYYHRQPNKGTLIQPTSGRCSAPLSPPGMN